MANILNGKELAKKMRKEIKAEVERLKSEYNITPFLGVILVEGNPASEVYVRNKEKACKKVGIESYTQRYPPDVPEQVVLDKIKEWNEDPKVNGILVQLPLPSHIDEEKIIEYISPAKDVDGFHPINLGKILRGREDALVPCTPQGVIELLLHYGIDPAGKDVVVIGRSLIVGRPLANLLSLKRRGGNATVTLCHTKTKDLKKYTLNADILIVAVGRPKVVTADMVKEGAVVVDVGVNRLPDGSLCGDVDFEEVSKKVSWISPVPGGVGPMTVTMLLWNTLKATKMQHNIK